MGTGGKKVFSGAKAVSNVTSSCLRRCTPGESSRRDRHRPVPGTAPSFKTLGQLISRSQLPRVRELGPCCSRTGLIYSQPSIDLCRMSPGARSALTCLNHNAGLIHNAMRISLPHLQPKAETCPPPWPAEPAEPSHSPLKLQPKSPGKLGSQREEAATTS